MSRKAFLFPGQGAQVPGMGKDFQEVFAVARHTFEEADDILGETLSRIIFEGPADLLTETRYSQLGIFVTSSAIFRTLMQQMPQLKPTITAGLSLGEYTALFASDRLSFKETLLLVRERARLMNEACQKVSGTMAAVLGLDGPIIEEALRGVEGVWVANYNTPGQIVISGTQSGVEKASLILKEKGAKRVLPLTVHGAFHSGLMASAKAGLAPFVEGVHLLESPIEFVMNVPGNFVHSLEEIKNNLISQVTHPVKWHQGIEAINARGVDFYLEMGPGKTLSGMNRKIGVTAPTFSVDKVADLDELAQKLATLGLS